jgi:hypothetical protein
VLSPDARSAAHRSARLDGLRLVAQLVVLSRRNDSLELRLQPNLPLGPDTGRLARGVVLAALGYALGLYETVTLRLDSPIPLTGGVGGRATTRLWRAVDSVVVESDADRELLSGVPGLASERIVVEIPRRDEPSQRAHTWPNATDQGLRESVLSEVRRAAAEELRLRSARRELKAEADEVASAFLADGRVRPSLQGLSETLREVLGRRVVALLRRQRAALGLALRSR